MRFFFRSKQFKIILAVFLSVVVLTVSFRFIGHKMAPTANIAGAIVAPFQSMTKSVTEFFDNLFTIYNIPPPDFLFKTQIPSRDNQKQICVCSI